MDVILFCKNLKSEDWGKPVTSKWRVKDVISHLVGWERECAIELPKTWATQKDPWFFSEKYNDFNDKIYEEFKNFSPDQLLAEFEKWHEFLEKEIQEIGAENIRQSPHGEWVFDEGAKPHFEHHLNQIRKVIKE